MSPTQGHEATTVFGTKFDTARANIEVQGGEAVIREAGTENVPLCMLTVTNNSYGGHAIYLDAGAFSASLHGSLRAGLANY